MIYFFPYPYQDETFYSLVSRYQVWSGNINAKGLLRELYGKDTIVASKHLPSNFNDLIEYLPINYQLGIDNLINDTTLYKYYTAFSDNEKASIIYRQMVEGEGSKIFASLGLSNNKIINRNNLKYCDKCLIEDKEKYGEAYWHREHQLAGIMICKKHKQGLIEIDNKDIKNRQEFISINHLNNIGEKILEEIDSQIINFQEKLIDNYRYLLDCIYKHKNKSFYRDYYISKLVVMGIADGRHKVNPNILHQRFIDYYGHDYLSKIGCDLTIGDNNSWLTKITRKHRTFFHPLYHSLLIDFLEIDIKELFNYSEYYGLIINKKMETYDTNDLVNRRNKWLDLMKNNPLKSTTKLREMDISTYSYLYRKDKQWLIDNLPVRKRRQGKKKINWEERDEEVLIKAKEAVEEILNKDIKPIRITKGVIARMVGEVNLIQKYLHKLPNTKAFIEENVETVEQFQERRIKWVKENCFDNELVSCWKLMKKSGIK